MEQLLAKYLALRDRKAELNGAHKAKIEAIDEALMRAEAVLLQQFQELGVESIRTESGTAYKSTLSYTSVGDWNALLQHVKEANEDLWGLLKKGVAKDAVLQYMEEHEGRLPPGVTLREEVTINVRRA